MKSLAYILSSFLIIGFISCGDGGTDVEVADDVIEAPVLKGYEELDLTQWGFNMTIMVPNAEVNGEPQIILTDRGALEVAVGLTFGIEIMYGEGDIELLKMDLKDDLVFSSEIIKEDENTLVYFQDIPNSGVKTQNHFFYKAVIGDDIFEIRDLMDGQYGKGMIEEMLAAAKTLKANSPKPTV